MVERFHYSRKLLFLWSSPISSLANLYGLANKLTSSLLSLSVSAPAMTACVVMLKDVKTRKFTEELLSLFPLAKTGEQHPSQKTLL